MAKEEYYRPGSDVGRRERVVIPEALTVSLACAGFVPFAGMEENIYAIHAEYPVLGLRDTIRDNPLTPGSLDDLLKIYRGDLSQSTNDYISERVRFAAGGELKKVITAAARAEIDVSAFMRYDIVAANEGGGLDLVTFNILPGARTRGRLQTDIATDIRVINENTDVSRAGVVPLFVA